MEENKGHVDGIKQSVENIIGSNTFLKRKRKSELDINREKFEKIINTLEEIDVRAVILEKDLEMDLDKYDDKFYTVIDILLEMNFGEEAKEVIFFYLYDRINPDGSMNMLRDPKGTEIILMSPTDLWGVVQAIKESKFKKKNASS